MRQLFRRTGNPRIFHPCRASTTDLVEHYLVVSGSLDEAGQAGARPSQASSSLLRPPYIKPNSIKNEFVCSTIFPICEMGERQR